MSIGGTQTTVYKPLITLIMTLDTGLMFQYKRQVFEHIFVYRY